MYLKDIINLLDNVMGAGRASGGLGHFFVWYLWTATLILLFVLLTLYSLVMFIYTSSPRLGNKITWYFVLCISVSTYASISALVSSLQLHLHLYQPLHLYPAYTNNSCSTAT